MCVLINLKIIENNIIIVNMEHMQYRTTQWKILTPMADLMSVGIAECRPKVTILAKVKGYIGTPTLWLSLLLGNHWQLPKYIDTFDFLLHLSDFSRMCFGWHKKNILLLPFPISFLKCLYTGGFAWRLEWTLRATFPAKQA